MGEKNDEVDPDFSFEESFMIEEADKTFNKNQNSVYILTKCNHAYKRKELYKCVRAELE